VVTESKSSTLQDFANSKAETSSLPDFANTKVAYASKSNIDLVRGLFVLFSCQEFLVLRADRLLSLCRTILGNKLTHYLVRESFFKHFCAGESQEEALELMTKLKSYGVGGILDFAAEGDVKGKTEQHLPVLSREYEYESERVCDKRMLNFEQCVAAAGAGGFAAVKVTALGDADTIRKISQCVLEIQDIFCRFDSSSKRKVLTKDTFIEEYSKYFIDDNDEALSLYAAILKSARERFHGDDLSLDDEIDLWEWLSFVTPREFVQLIKKMKRPPTHFTWTVDDSDKMDRMIKRLDNIAKKAAESSVKVLIDAEQTYFQPAIESFTLELQRRHNRSEKGAVVYGTYQAYLKDAKNRLTFALNASKREQWTFGCKVVRGAYMVRERALAEEEGRPSPVHDNIGNTAQSYRECCELILQSGQRSELLVASHNRQSIIEVIEVMDKHNRKVGGVSFAQLYGMADTVSFALAAQGHPVFKYLPFGPVDEVLPYLIRRAQENSSVVEGAKQEMKSIRKEIGRRMFG